MTLPIRNFSQQLSSTFDPSDKEKLFKIFCRFLKKQDLKGTLLFDLVHALFLLCHSLHDGKVRTWA